MNALEITKYDFIFSEIVVYSDGIPVVTMYSEYHTQFITKEQAKQIIDHLKKQFDL